MPLPQTTKRRWMVVAAVVLGSLACRYFALRSRAAYHYAKTTWSVSLTDRGCVYQDQNGKYMTSAEVKASPWHKKVSEIYRRAASRPWLPVEPIPPDPE